MTFPPGAITLNITLTYAVTDEIELRAAAMAIRGEANMSNADAIAQILPQELYGHLQLPGTTIAGATIARTDIDGDDPSATD